jgi:Family of unknown function (DUF6498)
MATLAQAHRFPTIIPLIVANSVPIVGVLFFGWDLLSIMFLYWTETAIVAFYSLLKVVKVGGLFQILPMTVNLLFVGIFMRVHLIFLLWLFGPPHRGQLPAEIVTPLLLKTWPSAVAFLVSHGVSFLVNFLGNHEYERTSVIAEHGAVWNRVVLMHMTIIFGGFVVMAANAPVGGLVMLGLLKIIADVRGHVRQRRGPVPVPAPAATSGRTALEGRKAAS